jgi:peptidoglycan-associated lipoprotein
MIKLLKPVCLSLLVASIAIIGCQKKVTTVETPPPPPPPKVEEVPPPPPPPPPPEDITGQLNALLQPIYFDFNKYELKSEGIATLERIASFLREHPGVRLMAEGNADERGSSEYNMGLGENRSRAVKNYLTSYGISTDRVETTSFGEERPVRSGCGNDDGCHQLNRRAEWQVLAK